MAARSASVLPVGDQYAYEPKFDGFRCVAFQRSNTRAILQSRNEKSLTSRFGDVAEAVHELVPAGTVLDGELVVLVDGRMDFVALQRRMVSSFDVRPAQLVAFDVLEDRGEDVRRLPYLERRALLEKVVGQGNAGVRLVPMTRAYQGAKAWLTEHTHLGIEGVVAKRVDQRYIPQTRFWTKVRTKATAEAIIGGITGTMAEPSGLILGRLDANGRLRVVGRTFPLPRAVRSDLGKLLTPAGDDHPWPRVIPGGRLGLAGSKSQTYTPVEPDLVVQVEVDHAFEHQRWRHGAQFLRARWDLELADVPILTS